MEVVGPIFSPLCLVSEIARFLGSVMGIAIANRKNRCNFGALRLNTNRFFLKLSGTPGISRQNPRISRQKVWFPWVSKDITELFFWPPPHSRGRPPPHPKISGPKSLGLGSFFFPEKELLEPQCPRTQTALWLPSSIHHHCRDHLQGCALACLFVSLFLCFFVSLFLCFFVSLFPYFLVSLSLCFLISWFPYFQRHMHKGRSS